MPHQCTNCGHRFEDGSKAMLSGCPSCDGNKFQFIPAGRDSAPAGSTGTEGATASGTNPTGTTAAAEGAAATDAGGIATGSSADDDPEDDAQTNARSSFVSSNELEEARRKMADAEEQRLAEVDGEVSERVDESAAAHEESAAAHDEADTSDENDNPNLQALRQELNDQFESIKIKAPGQYELNLMELYDREEYIISLREDGKYVIEMPESWRDDD